MNHFKFADPSHSAKKPSEAPKEAPTRAPKVTQSKPVAQPVAGNQIPTSTMAGKVIPGLAHTDFPFDDAKSKYLANKWNIPHYYLDTVINMNALLEFQTEINSRLQSQGKPLITLNDFYIMAASNSLTDVPDCNSQYHHTHIKKFLTTNIGFIGYSLNHRTSSP
jgi:pyruvate/2-oxoglutarate dehydrogenase complex dihydrolipoamide acyltransferase (E2) component